MNALLVDREKYNVRCRYYRALHAMTLIRRVPMAAKRDSFPEFSIRLPTGPELEILAVLWQPSDEENAKRKLQREVPIKLAEVHRLVKARREEYDQPQPAITTVSSTLRNMVAHDLVTEFRLVQGKPVEITRGGHRGTLHATRSPQTAYLAKHPPQYVIRAMMKVLSDSYPKGLQRSALEDLAVILGAPINVMKPIRDWIENGLL